MGSEFVHLHNHSDYSLLDGAQTVDSTLKTVAELKMDAIAITEHGNLFSAISFYKEAKEAGIKPIIGCEIYVAQGSRTDKVPRVGGGWGNNHLVLLSQNYTGYRNLMKLVTHGYLEGFYYRPRVDKELLRKYNEGLICLSACLKGEVQEKAVSGDYDGAKRAAIEFSEIFPERFYLELQNHEIPEEDASRNFISKISEETGIPLVATNDCHYSKKEHWQAHDIMFCLGTGKERNDPNRRRYATPEFYIKSQDEMWGLFKSYGNALENTRRIVDSCNLEIPLGSNLLPVFPIPADTGTNDADEYLANLCRKKLPKRIHKITPELESHLNYELSVIKKMGFAGYFLIVMDFVEYARVNDIPVGPGRGSVTGSLVAYILGITNINPITYNLLFERFLNPDRISMPDIDIDFCYERRQEVIDYIKIKYGDSSVSQIITFGKLKARQVVRDTGRVLGLNYAEVDRIAKMIPPGPGVTLDDAVKLSSELQNLIQTNPQYREIFEFSKVLEGMNRHASTHAAGIVITPGDLTEYTPLYKSPQGDVTTQFDMKSLEHLGLLKMDFLGLRNLTVIDQTIKLLKERNTRIDIDQIPFDDKKTFEMFSKGNTVGVFQFESSGMREYLKKLKPTCLEDLIAMNALYRPGPMENIDDFIKRKHKRKKTEYLHPKLEPILKETYGVIVYQEQVMQIAHTIGGLSLAQADIMRRAMGKKQHHLMQKLQSQFIEGAVEQGIPKSTAEKIYEFIERFAQYGFNKSHSAAYAYIAYQTAYLKIHYPAEFLAATLTSEMNNTDRVVTLINECRKLNITIHKPSVIESDIHFKALDSKTISFGLNAIKNVGMKALENIIETRKKFGVPKTLFDFVEHLDLRLVNRKVLESLIAAGAMDSLEGNRAQKYDAVEMALEYAQQAIGTRDSNQVSMFDLFASSDTSFTLKPSLPLKGDWSEQEKLKREKDLIGFFITGHPLLKFADELEQYTNIDFTTLEEENHIPEVVRVGGIIETIKLHFDKKNQQMAFFTLDCLGGKVEVLAFSDTYKRHLSLLKEGELIFIRGRSTTRLNEALLKVVAEEIYTLDQVRNIGIKKVNIVVEVAHIDVDSLYSLVLQHKGKSTLYLHAYDENGETQTILVGNITVSSDTAFLNKLKGIYGDSNVWLEE